MPVILPIIGAFATVSAAGGIAAAVSTIGGFLSVAGGVMAGLGIVTGSKDLKKIGGLLSLGSAAVGALSSAGAAASGAGEASSAWDAAGSAAGSDAAQFAKYAREPLGSLGAQGATGVAEATQGLTGSEMAGLGAEPWRTPGYGGEAVSTQPSLLQQAPGRASDAARPIGGTSSAAQALDPVAQAGSTMTQGDLTTYLNSAWDKVKGGVTGVGQFVKDNKDLVGMVGQAFSPESEFVDLKRQQAQWEQSLIQRRLRNLNNPVRLGPYNPSPAGG